MRAAVHGRRTELKGLWMKLALTLARRRMRLAAMGIPVVLAVAACGSGAVETSPPVAGVPDSSVTMSRSPLVRELTGAVTDSGALDHLQALQKIADANGGNRAVGTPGY